MLIMKRIQWLMEALMLSVIEFMYLFLVLTLLCVVLVLLFDIDSEKVHWLPYVWNVHSQSIKQFIFKCKKHTPCSVSQQFTLHWRNDLHNELFYKCRKTLKYVPKHGIGIMSLHWDFKLIAKRRTTFCQWSTEIGGSPISESQVAFTNVCLHPNDTGDLHLVCPYETRGLHDKAAVSDNLGWRVATLWPLWWKTKWILLWQLSRVVKFCGIML